MVVCPHIEVLYISIGIERLNSFDDGQCFEADDRIPILEVSQRSAEGELQLDQACWHQNGSLKGN